MLLVGVDGFDGAGKTTQCTNLARGVAAMGLRVELVGRDGATSDSYVHELTKLIKLSDGLVNGRSFGPAADYHVRLARWAQRVVRIQQSTADVVVCDRFLLNDLSMVMVAEDRARYVREFVRIVPREMEVVHFSLHGPFDLLMSRIFGRGAMSPKEALGEDHLSNLFEAFELAAATTRVPWPIHRIPTTSGPEEVGAVIHEVIKEQLQDS